VYRVIEKSCDFGSSSDVQHARDAPLTLIIDAKLINRKLPIHTRLDVRCLP